MHTSHSFGQDIISKATEITQICKLPKSHLLKVLRSININLTNCKIRAFNFIVVQKYKHTEKNTTNSFI